MSRYVNQVRITSGRRVEVQYPIDDRFTFYNNADVLADILDDQPVRWFEGMQIQVITSADSYLWLAVDNLPPNVVLLNSSLYTYATDYPDPLYAGREFGFFKLAKMVSKHSELVLDDGTNPHGTTKSNVGLSNVDNTSDTNKPVSTAQQLAINGREPNLGNPAGNGYVLYSTVAGVRYWGSPQVGTSGIPEAPTDSKPYVRRNSAWVECIVKQDFTNLQTEVDNLEIEVTALQNDIIDLETQVDTLSDEVDALQVEVTNIPEYVEYDVPTDTYKLTPTLDGQTQNLGQEMFFSGVNIGVDGALATAPKLFAAGAIIGTPNKFNVLKVNAAALSQNFLYGLNTTDIGGLGTIGKFLTYGNLNNVDTSAWAINTRLYVDTVAGDLTSVKPAINIFYVGSVKVQDAVNGVLFVNTIQSNREDTAIDYISSIKGFFSGLLATAPANAFYITDNDSATGSLVTQTIAAPQNGTAWIPIDTVGKNTTGFTLKVGQVLGQIEFEINSNQGGEQLFIEVYKANNAGVPIDAGNALAVGNLGVRPIVVLASSVLNLDTGITLFIALSGYIYTEVTLAPTERLRYHTGASKIGGNASVKNFTIRQGGLSETYAELPLPIQATDVAYNGTLSGLAATDVQQMGDELASKILQLSKDVSIITEPNSSRLLTLSDAHKYIRFTSTIATIIVDVPDNATTPFPIGTVIIIRQTTVTDLILFAVSTTIINGKLKCAGIDSEIKLTKVAINTWDAIGGIDA